MEQRLATLLAIVREHGAPDELARNLAGVDPTEPGLIYSYIREQVIKRRDCFGVHIEDVDKLSRALWRAAC